MIEVSGLTKRYGDLKALDDVSFKVEKGQIVGFLGANGAGKTTAMDIICGCTGADQGVAKVDGYDITESPVDAKKHLGYLPDVPPLYPDMRVRDYVNYVAKLHRVPSSKRASRVDDTMEKLSITDVRDRLVGNLSKGYRQRVALAQAIVHEPDVLVLDEPTEGLDPNQIVHIRELIRNLSGEHTIILSSHILSEVQNTCDQIIIIHKGRVLRQGRYEELVSHLEAGRTYRLKVQRDGEKLAGELEGLRGVSGARVASAERETELEFAVAEGDESALDEVAKAVVNGGYGLRELGLKTKSLEEVFFQVTQ